MLSYRHGFHAGNHADVLKHSVLALVTRSFCKKEKPFVYFDTHTGAGLYSLEADWAKTTGEAEKGIIRLFDWLQAQEQDLEQVQVLQLGQNHGLVSGQDIRPSLPTVFIEYLKYELDYYQHNAEYAGSPWIAKHFSREQDSLVLMELHNNEIDILRENVKIMRWGNVHVHHRDGFSGLNALTPPRPPLPPRGFVLIDPSYETGSDYSNVAQIAMQVLKKWKGCTILIWYPLLQHRQSEIELLRDTFRTAEIESLDVQLLIDNPEKNAARLYGSGVLLLQPPWKIEDDLQILLPFLADRLGLEGRGGWVMR